jgi:phosphoribosylaminoimidazolecarboxamide formyltransferase/IMP cyclohydrolase
MRFGTPDEDGRRDVKSELKYGENPHQEASITLDTKSKDPLALARFTTAAGEPVTAQLPYMGWVNLKDLSRGIDCITRIAAAFEVNTGAVPKIAVIVEHGNACGAAAGQSEQVINDAIQGNYRASFGSFLITNVEMTEPVAFKVRQWMAGDRPFSGIAAPVVDEIAAAYFKRKKGRCHMLANPALGNLGVASLDPGPVAHTIRGATLVQATGTYVPKFPGAWDKALIADMCLAWGVCSASSSNAITIAKDGFVIANAVGQQERAAAAELAILQAKKSGHSSRLKGASVVSDSFFPFADAFDLLARRKVKAIFATHGSVHDKAVAEHAKQFDVLFHTVPDAKARIFAGH